MIDVEVTCGKCICKINYGFTISYSLDSLPGASFDDVEDLEGLWVYINGIHYCTKCAQAEFPVLKYLKFEDLKQESMGCF